MSPETRQSIATLAMTGMSEEALEGLRRIALSTQRKPADILNSLVLQRAKGITECATCHQWFLQKSVLNNQKGRQKYCSVPCYKASLKIARRAYKDRQKAIKDEQHAA